MTPKKEPAQRAYLARDDRRAALLDVAATVVETQGWPALSMISVAETAEVSRQLVYQHFTSVLVRLMGNSLRTAAAPTGPAEASSAKSGKAKIKVSSAPRRTAASPRTLSKTKLRTRA